MSATGMNRGSHLPGTANEATKANESTRAARATEPGGSSVGPTTQGSPTGSPSARLWLRRFLALDAVVTGSNGLAYLAVSGPLASLLGVGQPLLPWIGAFLLLYGVGVGVLASRPVPPVLPVRLVIDLNLAWAVGSLLATVFWFEEPTIAGYVWVPLQAGVVAAFAVLQYGSLRRARL